MAAAKTPGKVSPAIGPVKAYLYVTSYGTNQVVRYDATTGAFHKVWDQGDGMKLVNPTGMAWGPDGNLYVASDNNLGQNNAGQILEYNGGNGNLIGVFETGSDPKLPAGVAFGPDGNLYVVDSGNNVVDRYQGPNGTTPGAPLPSTGNQGAVFASTPPTAFNLSNLVFGSDKKLYVSDAGGGGNHGVGVDRFNADGSFDKVFVTVSSQNGLYSARGVAFGADGNFYVANASNNVVDQFDNTGKFLTAFASGGGLQAPYGIVFGGPNNNLFVADYKGNDVIQYSKTDGSVVQPNPFASGHLTNPWDVNFTPGLNNGGG